MKLASALFFATLALGQNVVIPDLATAKWAHDARDGSDSVLLREDAKTGAMDLLVRFPAGKKLSTHWHSVNERLILLEGKMKAKVGAEAEVAVSPGGIVMAAPKEPHGFSCVSATACTFYIAWDGKLDSHKVQ